MHYKKKRMNKQTGELSEKVTFPTHNRSECLVAFRKHVTHYQPQRQIYVRLFTQKLLFFIPDSRTIIILQSGSITVAVTW